MTGIRESYYDRINAPGASVNTCVDCGRWIPGIASKRRCLDCEGLHLLAKKRIYDKKRRERRKAKVVAP